MLFHERIRKIREYRGLKQLSVAAKMNITQQAYSWLETKSGNIKMETLQRFCEVMNVDLPFLMATDIPITPENMETFAQMSYSRVFEDYKRMKSKMINYEEIVLRRAV